MSFYFKEPRFQFNYKETLFVKWVSYLTYTALLIITLGVFSSNNPSLKWLGVLSLLFLLDRSLHIKEGEKTTERLKKQAKEGQVNLAKGLTPHSRKTLAKTKRHTLRHGGNFNLILIKQLIQRDDVKESLKRLGIDPGELLKKIKKLNEKKTKTSPSEINKSIKNIIKNSFKVALSVEEKFIQPRDLLVGVAQTEDPKIKKLLSYFEINPKDIREAIIFGRFHSQKSWGLPKTIGEFAHKQNKPRKRVMNRAWTARPTPYLDKFSKDLTALARRKKVGLLVGQKEEFNKIMDTLTRPDKPNALISGRPGVGKSAIINHLAYRIIKDEVPENLFDKRLISLDIGSLIANADPKEISARIKKIANEISKAGNLAIFIPDIHQLFKSTNQGSDINPMDILLPIIKNRKFPFIAETTPSQFKKHIEGNSKFLQEVEKIKIEEVSQEEAIRILTYKGLVLEKDFDLKVTLKSVKEAVSLADKYLSQKPLPASAMDLLKQSMAKAHRLNKKVLDKETVVEVAESLSKIPISEAKQEEAEKLLNLEEKIHQRLVNQKEAVKAVSNYLREYRSGLSSESGPIANFLFVGPTGVGKTELSKQLSKVQFGSKKAMIRFDMSEYQNKESLYQLIGTPDGEKTGSLTDAVLNQPYSLILLDEFEKAHPDILNLFLKVFDDGRLTDNRNRTVKFENTIIIATSNAHSKYIKEKIEQGENPEEISKDIKQKLTKYFKPELLNRFSEIIVFKTLTKDEINQITKFMIEELSNKIKEKKNIELKVKPSAIEKISEMGYSPVFGARPLKSTISEQIKSELAEKILSNEINEHDTVEITFEKGKFKFKSK